jgi:aminoglycoside phosphotransferase (APT) family kinase protein
MDDAALFEALPEAEVARRLLPYLGESGAGRGLDYAAPPRRLLGGFDTLIYRFELRDPPPALAGPLVLRLYRDARGPDSARRESIVQNAVAALGFPTPRILRTCIDRTVLGGAFVIMPYVHGRVMRDAFFGPRALDMCALLASLHARLHGLDADALARDAAGTTGSLSVGDELDVMQAQIGAARLAGLDPGMQWVRARRPPLGQAAICHGDFHPLNVLIDGAEVSGVLDWARAKIDDPAWDVGATVALFTQGPIDLPGVLQGAAGAVRRWLIGRYLRAYTTLRSIDLAAVQYYEAVRCLGMLIEAGEHRQAARGFVAPIAKPTAFNTARSVRSLSARFAAVSGVAVALPS